MTSRLHVLGFVVVLATGLLGCEDNSLSDYGGPSHPGNGYMGDTDSGTFDGEDDAEVEDAGVSGVLGCIDVDEGDGDNTGTVIGTIGDTAFDVTRAFAAWSTNCDDPGILVGLGENTCSATKGERFVIRVRRDAVGTSIYTGVNFLEDDPNGDLQARFVLPASEPGSSDPDTVWSNCVDSAGSVTFDELDTFKNAVISGTFDVTLTRCDAPTTTDPVRVTGNFLVNLPESFASACP